MNKAEDNLDRQLVDQSLLVLDSLLGPMTRFFFSPLDLDIP
jgi:hypothetical protein